MKTKEKIQQSALELFNVHGIEYISLLEIGKPLGLKSGNISRHFPKKEDLVNALALQFSEKNNLFWATADYQSVDSFMSQLTFYSFLQQNFRCLFISLPHLQSHYPEIATRFKKEEQLRKKKLRLYIDAWIKEGDLKKLTTEEEEFLVTTVLMMLRCWIPDSVVTQTHAKREKQNLRFLSGLKNLFLLFASERGKRKMLDRSTNEI